jgi:carboxylesterase type B
MPLLAELNCSGAIDTQRACLATKSTADIVAAASGPLMPSTSGTSLPHPTVDGVELTGSPYGLLAEDGSGVPLLLGSNTNEGTFFLHDPPPSAASLAAQLRALTRNNTALFAAADGIYSPGAGASPAAWQKAAADSMGHAKVNCVARRVAATAQSGRSWLYHFARFDPCGGFDNATDGVTHTMELAYVFGQPGCAAGWPNPADTAVSDAMMTAWADFASGEAGGHAPWEAAGPGAANSLRWDVGARRYEKDWLSEECALWDKVEKVRGGS